MTLSNQSSAIRFSVEESVWFKKGQEVSDLLAMSLDPEISVQEHENYIYIRGALVLSGDYYPHEADQENEEEIHSLRDTAALRTIDEVTENDEGIYRMCHRFPIDITIPSNRINNLEDVYVLIEAFDYEIPERGRLELKADLAISGIISSKTSSSSSAVPEEAAMSFVEERREEEPKDSRREHEEPPYTEANATEERFPSFFTEVRKEVRDVENEEIEENVQNVKNEEIENDIGEEVAVLSPPSRSESKQTVVEELDDKNINEIQEEIDDESIEEIPVNIGAKQNSPQIGMKSRAEEQDQKGNLKSLYLKQSTYQEALRVEEIKEDEQQDRKENTKRSLQSENALYLTNMLSSDGEEDFSKLRMRIVQNGETIGTIAESYDISPNQIIRMNGLEDDVIETGQILYIPEYAGVE